MNFKCEQTETVRTIRIYGDINKFELQGLKSNFADLKSLSELVVDLADVDFAGSDFLNLLLDIRHQYPNDYVKIVFLNPNELLQELFEMTGLDQVYRIRIEISEAVIA
jgi:anti-anti-sigma factor